MLFELEGIRDGKTQMKFSKVKHILHLQPALSQHNDRVIPKYLQSQNNTGSLLQLLISYQGQVTLKVLFVCFQGLFLFGLVGFFLIVLILVCLFLGGCIGFVLLVLVLSSLSLCLALSPATITKQKTKNSVLLLYHPNSISMSQKQRKTHCPLPFYHIPDQ